MDFYDYDKTVRNAVNRFKTKGFEPPRALNQWRAIVRASDYTETRYDYEFFGKTYSFTEGGFFGSTSRRLQDSRNIKKMETEFRKHARDLVTVTALSDYPDKYRMRLRNIILEYRFVIWRWDTYGAELQEWILNPKRGVVGEEREGLL